jgi:hypothetical protein
VVHASRDERLIAVDPDDGSDREPDRDEPDHREDDFEWPPRADESDRAAPALEAFSGTEIGCVVIRRSEPSDEVSLGR